MRVENVVLRLNLKGLGESFYWRDEPPPFANSRVQLLLPQVGGHHHGPNIAFSAVNQTANRFFFATVSSWPKPDEFGRRGLLLAHGEVMSVDAGSRVDVLGVCRHYLALTRFHESGFRSLGGVVGMLATQGTVSDVRELLAHLQTGELDVRFPAQEIWRLSEMVQRGHQRAAQRLQVSIAFPASPAVGVCAVIAAQLRTDQPSHAVGGALEGLDGVDYLLSSEDAPGFRRLLLEPADSFLSRPGSHPAPGPSAQQPEEQPVAQPGSPNAIGPAVMGPTRRLKILGVLALLALATFAGPPIPKTMRPAGSARLEAKGDFRHRRSADLVTTVQRKPAPARPAPESTSPGENERGLIVSQLFGDSNQERMESLRHLDEQRWLDATTVDRVLGSAEDDTTNLEGVLAALLYLERRDLVLLEPQAARLLVLLGKVSNNGPRTRTVSARLLGRLAGAERPDRRSAAQP